LIAFLEDYPCAVVDHLVQLYPEDLYKRFDNMDLAINSLCGDQMLGGLGPSGYSKTIESTIKKNPGSLMEMNLAGNLPIRIHTAGLGMRDRTRETPSSYTEGLRAQHKLLDQTYLETLTQFSDTDDTNARRVTEHLPPWHKAAWWISHLFTPDKSKVLFLVTDLRSASYG
jgi:hypothetical protein